LGNLSFRLSSFVSRTKMYSQNPTRVSYHTQNDSLLLQEWLNDEEMYHRVGGPARIQYNENGSLSSQGWFENGEYHRLDGPASTYTSEDGSSVEVWMKNGIRHRIEGPAVIINRENFYSEEWFQNGILHRIDGPAYLCIENEVTVIEQYFKNGKYHRINGPANTIYFSRKKLNGEVYRTLWVKEWFENGKYQPDSNKALVSGGALDSIR